MCIIMAAASFRPAVASRRAKYECDFRVQTLLDAIATHNIDIAIEPEEGRLIAHLAQPDMF